ncbi:hypothetical protein [Aromatoleum sp.]|uniref:hypothetical protein n=1 Tax=Aromatoleum sp. TaxID=2307007 RepID=UPI002FCC30CC
MSSEGRSGSRGNPRQRSHWLRRVAYWGLVLVVSVVLVVLLLGFFESRDASEVGATAVTERLPHAHPAKARAA